MKTPTILTALWAILCLIGLQSCEYVIPEQGRGTNNRPIPTTTIDLECLVMLPTKMNILYIGVENPIHVSFGKDQSLKDVRISCQGAGCRIKENGSTYSVLVNAAGITQITVSHGEEIQEFNFRARRVPDPIPSLRGIKPQASGHIGSAAFKDKEGVYAPVLNFGFDIECKIQGFELARISREGKRTKVMNAGGRYAGKVAQLIANAQPGDLYYYDNIKARCPGDTAGRKLPPMVWEIK